MGKSDMSGGAGGNAAAEARPRLGVLLVTSGWFRDVGLQGAGSDTTQEVARPGPPWSHDWRSSRTSCATGSFLRPPMRRNRPGGFSRRVSMASFWFP